MMRAVFYMFGMRREERERQKSSERKEISIGPKCFNTSPLKLLSVIGVENILLVEGGEMRVRWWQLM